MFPETEIKESLYVIDRDRISCCGGVASVDTALEIIHLQHGINLTNATAHYIFQKRLRSGDVGLSSRHLQRLFAYYTGKTPVQFYLDLRLDRARGLVTQTELSLVEIAGSCGFTRSETFSRAYKKRFGITPGRDRIEGRVPFQFRSFPSHADI